MYIKEEGHFDEFAVNNIDGDRANDALYDKGELQINEKTKEENNIVVKEESQENHFVSN